MSKPRRIEFDKPIAISIVNWADFLGKNPVDSPRFIMLPTRLRHTKRWDMDGDLLRFFLYLVMHAAFQEEPGKIQGDAYSISKACRCRVDSVPRYIQRLIQTQFIQEVTKQDWIEGDKKGGEENGSASPPQGRLASAEGGRPMPAGGAAGADAPGKRLTGAGTARWKELWEKIPDEARSALGIRGYSFEVALELARRNESTIEWTGHRHLITDEIFQTEIIENWPGSTARDTAFCKSYCRLVLHDPRGLIFIQRAMNQHRSGVGAKWDSGAHEYVYEDLFWWLQGTWWECGRENDGKGNYPKSLSYKGKNPRLAQQLHNISNPALNS